MFPVTFVDNTYFNAPILTPVIGTKGAKLFELADDWIVRVDALHWLRIPRGTLTNYGTVPWFLRWIVSPTDPVISIPSIIHDYLVAEHVDPSIRHTPLHIPKIYYYKLSNAGPVSVVRELYHNQYDWIESAKLFRQYAHSFEGRTARIKAEVCYYFIRLRGILRGY